MTEKFVLLPDTNDDYANIVLPTIKGNGFDGLAIDASREDAQKFIDWINARLPSIALIGLPVIEPELLPIKEAA